MFHKLAELFSTDPFEVALRCLRRSADKGNIEAQQLLRLYDSIRSRRFSPLNDTICLKEKHLSKLSTVLKEKKSQESTDTSDKTDH